MKQNLKSVSKLSIFFIIVVFFSGSILTFFSIDNISNLEELTEKKILEEERELSQRFSKVLKKNIDQITINFDKEIRHVTILKDSLIKTKENFNFINLPFIVTNRGILHYPNFVGITNNINEKRFSNNFKTLFSKGEKFEFTDNDLRNSKKYYLSSLNNSKGSSESAKSLNALGRVLIKLNDYESAIYNYSKVILDYYLENDRNNLTYASYAISQLLKISDKVYYDSILTITESFVIKLYCGLIPISFSTEDLIQNIQDWIKEKSFEVNEKVEHIEKMIKHIKEQIRFINDYGSEIADIDEKTNFENNMPIENNFEVISSFSTHNKKLIIINSKFEYYTGFLIDIQELIYTVLKEDLQYGFEFDYKIDFVSSRNSKITSNNFIHTSQINPFLSGLIMQIKPADENLIKDLIERRNWIYGIATVLLIVGMFLGIALIIRDIVREKHLARLRSEFISNVTHELKTPLTSIYMFTESLLLERIKTDHSRKEYLSIILKESKRLKRMINNILDFSKIEKGKSEWHFNRSNLSTIIESAIHDMDYWFEEEEFELTLELDKTIFAEVDKEKIKQAINNLLSNAIKYSLDEKRVSVRLYKNNGYNVIEFEDFGIGIQKHEIAHIFEEYYRIEQKENISGTGLGLTVVKEIVDAHKGNISVFSEFGKGTKFIISLKNQVNESENNIGS